MKKILFFSSLSLFIVGCNMNPNKEARIQQLESELEQSIERINALELRVESLERANKLNELKIIDISSTIINEN